MKQYNFLSNHLCRSLYLAHWRFRSLFLACFLSFSQFNAIVDDAVCLCVYLYTRARTHTHTTASDDKLKLWLYQHFTQKLWILIQSFDITWFLLFVLLCFSSSLVYFFFFILLKMFGTCLADSMTIKNECMNGRKKVMLLVFVLMEFTKRLKKRKKKQKLETNANGPLPKTPTNLCGSKNCWFNPARQDSFSSIHEILLYKFIYYKQC